MKTLLTFNHEGAKAQRFSKELSLHSRTVGGMNMFMNPSACFKRSNRRLLKSQNQNRAFTLTELAVVIATIAVLAMVVLSALAGVQNKGGRTQCAANLRQIYVASMIYASEYRGLLPFNTVASPGIVNSLHGIHYTYFVTSPFGFSTPSVFIPTNAPASYFSDLGFLYHAGLAGNGQIFYCPDSWGWSVWGANNYLPLLTSDAGGRVRSSYAFNPRILDPNNTSWLRAYQKTSDLPPHKLFTVDYFGNAGAGGPGSIPHFREDGGWSVLFTDGSMQFSRNPQALNLIQNFVSAVSVANQQMEYQILDLLELDH